jgi:hypothetical protein
MDTSAYANCASKQRLVLAIKSQKSNCFHRNTETRICNALNSNILCYAGETWNMTKVEMTLAALEQKTLKRLNGPNGKMLWRFRSNNEIRGLQTMYPKCGNTYWTQKAETAWIHLRHGGIRNTEENLRWKRTWQATNRVIRGDQRYHSTAAEPQNWAVIPHQ